MHARLCVKSSVDRIAIPSQNENASSLFHAAIDLNVLVHLSSSAVF